MHNSLTGFVTCDMCGFYYGIES